MQTTFSKRTYSSVTIHEIGSKIDHWPIIAQKEIELYSWDTSLTVYNRILEAEIELIDQNLDKIIEGNYATTKPFAEGNLNLLKDFNSLCEIDMNKNATFGEVIDKLRALTHGDYKNAHFYDPVTSKKIYVRIDLLKED